MASDVMKKTVIAAIAVVIVLLVAGAFVVLSMNTPSSSGKDDGKDDDNNNNNNNNNNNTNNNTNPTNNTTPNTIDLGARTLNITFPASLGSAEPKVSLAVTYPGKGVADYTYNRSQSYHFQIASTPANGYSGDVLIRMFAELTDPVDEIDPQNLMVTNETGRVLDWTTATRVGQYTNYIVISGDLGAFRTNGNATDVRTFDVTLNYIGNFTLTFQAFDLNNNATLSEPTVAGPMYVPIKGSLSIHANSIEQYSNGTGEWYRVLINVTNNWNIRYTVYASGFVINNTVDEFAVNDTATAFNSQQLTPLGGTTQFLAYFDATGDRANFTMTYTDPVSGEVINVPLPVPA
ncbi:MAG: hypothetical protein SA339_00815 [Methanomassiliicoccus sp.]|nr:hypothetical protein [Methanomassiliicoccus sp.]